MNTIIRSSWYTCQQAAFETGLPLKQMQALYKAVLDGKHGKIAVSYYGGADTPAIQGMDLLMLIGQLPPPTARHRKGRY